MEKNVDEKGFLDSTNEREFAEKYTHLVEFIKKDPIENFIKHKAFMNFSPTPAQTVAFKCVFGQQLDPITPQEVYMEVQNVDGQFSLEKRWMTEVELFEYMTDQKYDPTEQGARSRINLIIGRRGGKSLCAAILSIYYAVTTNWKPFLKKTPAATVAVLSHSREFSDEILELIRQLVEDSPVLVQFLDPTKKNTRSTFNLKVPFLVRAKSTVDGKKIQYSRVTIKVDTASKKTVRGKAICVLICDEIAYWNLDENAADRDVDILRAARPALLQFGRYGLILKLSSPGIKQGVLYEEYQKRHNLPKNYLTLKAPSWVWNVILERQTFYEEYLLDPMGFDAEYRANFVDSISNFILPEFVDLCTLRGQTFLPPEDKKSDIVYCASLDAAFKGDRFAFTLMGVSDNKVKQYVIKTWEGTREKPVKAYEVAEYVRNICKEYGIARTHCDQYAYQPLREIFEQFGITLIENSFTNTFKKQIYFNLKRLIHSQAIDLLDYILMLNEIKQLQVEQTATGTVRIGHAMGFTDDCSDAVAIAAYLLAENLNAMGIAPGEIAGIPEYGIRRDSSGRCFDAPDPTTLSEMYGYAINDNRNEWRRDTKTGEWKHCSEDDEDELDGVNEDGSDFIFVGD